MTQGKLYFVWPYDEQSFYFFRDENTRNILQY
jgi:hypothetical protein